MACASGFREPSLDTTRHLRWLYLLQEGGTLVLRDVFDQMVPKPTLSARLKAPAVKVKMLNLHKQGRLTDIQKNKLYPEFGQPDSSTFDITLLTCLLQSICGLNGKSPAWQGQIQPNDVSVESDICRLREFRNEASHTPEFTMDERTFQSKWDQLEQVLIRLGKHIPNLKDNVESCKSDFIDKECERQLKDTLKEWEESDRVLQRDLLEIKEEQQKQSRELDSLSQTVTRNEQKVETKLSDTRREQDNLRNETKILQENVEAIKDSQQKIKEDIEKVKAEREQQEKLMSSELKDIASKSKMQVEDAIETRKNYMSVDIIRSSYNLQPFNRVLVLDFDYTLSFPMNGELYFAGRVGLEEVVDLDVLKQLMADPNVTCICHNIPLDLAVYVWKKDAVERLLDLNKSEKQRFTPLLAAIHRDHVDVAYLLCPKVDINKCDKYGRTRQYRKGIVNLRRWEYFVYHVW